MNGRTRVVHIIDELPPDGAERLLADLLTFRSTALDYSVLCIDAEGQIAEEIRAMGVPVHLLGRRKRLDPRLCFRLRAWLKEQKVSVVHTHLFAADAYGRLAALLAGVPAIVCTIHNTNEWKSRAYRLADLALANLTSAVIACTDQVARILVERDHIPPHKVLAIRNGVNIERVTSGQRERLRREWGLRNDELLIGVVGRLHPQKSHRTFLEALARSTGEAGRAKAVFVGSGPLENELRGEAARLNLTARVTFAGQRRDMADVYAALDVLAMPSAWEGLPITLLEAMACALPIVATRVGGVPDVIEHGRTGILIEPGDVDALAKALSELCMNPERRRALGDACPGTVRERFDIAATMRAYEALYDRILEERTSLGARSSAARP